MSFSYKLSGIFAVAAIAIVQHPVAIAQVDRQIAATVKEVTVVINGINPGSGVIIGKEGNTYYVLTAKHVVPRPDEYEIVTPDGNQYPFTYQQVTPFPNVDLAIVRFTSDRNYPIAVMGDSDAIAEGSSIYTAGWPHPGTVITQRIFQITAGQVSGRSLGSLEDGYEMIYTNITGSGMSGGGVFDESGRLVGIHGQAEGQPVYDSQTGERVNVKAGFNLGIPINTYLNLASQLGVNTGYFFGSDFQLINILDLLSQNNNIGITALAVSINGQKLATGGSFGLKIWDTKTGQLLQILENENSDVDWIGFTPDGTTLLSRSSKIIERDKGRMTLADEEEIKTWNINTGELVNTIKIKSRVIPKMSIRNDIQILAIAEQNALRIWDFNTGKLIRTLDIDHEVIEMSDFSADGKLIATISAISESNQTRDIEYRVKILQVETGKILSDFLLESVERIRPKWYFTKFSADGNFLFTVSGNFYNLLKVIKIWDTQKFQLLHTLESPVEIGSFTSNAKYLVTASSEGKTEDINRNVIDPDATVNIWDIKTGELINTLTGHSGAISSLSMSPDGNFLVTGSYDGTMKIWSLITGELLQTLEVKSSRGYIVPSGIGGIHFSGDGHTLVSAELSLMTGAYLDVQIWKPTYLVYR